MRIDGVWIHQNAWFFLGEFDKNQHQNYLLKDNSNGIYIFVLEGEVTIENQTLSKRDGLGIWNKNQIEMTVNNYVKLLLMEVPMTV